EHSWDGKHHLVIPVFAYAGTEKTARRRGELADIRHYNTRDTGFFVRFSRTFLWAILDEHYQYQFELGWYLKLRNPLAARLYEFLSPLIGFRLTYPAKNQFNPQTSPARFR